MQAHELEVGRQRLLLRLPVLVCHRISESSPLRAWRGGASALAADANSEIVVVVRRPPNPRHASKLPRAPPPADVRGLGPCCPLSCHPQERWQLRARAELAGLMLEPQQ